VAFLAPGGADVNRQALDYGYSYLEKFIQIPFGVPRPSASVLPEFLLSLDPSATAPTTQDAAANASRSPEVEVTFSTDSDEFRSIVEAVAPTLEFNPRRLKQFVNLFRLRAYIASNTGLFVPSDSGTTLTLRQLATFIAMTLRWPQLALDLSNDPDLLKRLSQPALGPIPSDSVEAYWRANAQLLPLLPTPVPGSIDEPVDMSNVDVMKLLEVSPRYVATERTEQPGPNASQAAQYTPPPPFDSSLKGAPA
jgi:hypothetical protein